MITAFLKRFASDTGGNIATLFAGVSITLLMGVGVAIDSSNIQKERQRLQAAADAAALAGAISAYKNTAGRHDSASNAFTGNANAKSGSESGVPNITFDDVQEQVVVLASAKVDLFVMNIFMGRKATDITVQSTASYRVDDLKPISLSMALDVSGSMSWTTTGLDGSMATATDPVKIDVLKSASRELFQAIEDGVSDKAQLSNVLRTSMAAYNTAVVDDQTMSTGYSITNAKIQALPASGGTNSTPALTLALSRLMADPNRATNNVREYLIFMTDGDNNDALEDPNSIAVCDQARAEGITVYSVAFAAPDKGQQLLLRCASAPTADAVDACDGNLADATVRASCEAQKADHYFDASSAAEFKAAFKKIGDEIGEQVIRLKS